MELTEEVKSQIKESRKRPVSEFKSQKDLLKQFKKGLGDVKAGRIKRVA